MKSQSIHDIQSQIDNLEIIRKHLFAEQSAINLKIQENYSAIAKLKDSYSNIFLLNNDLSFHDRLTFLLNEDGSGGQQAHDDCFNLFNNQLSGLSTSGYFPYSKQKAIKITLLKGDNCNLDSTYKSLNDILDVIKPFNDKGDKLFSLFEHTLSEFGSYDIKLSSDNFWSLVDGRERTLKTFNSLLDTLKYCQIHHYYKSSLPEDNIYED